VIPSKSYFGGSLPFAFTEQGVAMLSSESSPQPSPKEREKKQEYRSKKN
jgi:hypothetical protein